MGSNPKGREKRAGKRWTGNKVQMHRLSQPSRGQVCGLQSPKAPKPRTQRCQTSPLGASKLPFTECPSPTRYLADKLLTGSQQPFEVSTHRGPFCRCRLMLKKLCSLPRAQSCKCGVRKGSQAGLTPEPLSFPPQHLIVAGSAQNRANPLS